MIRAAIICAMMATSAQAQELSVPSGTKVVLFDTITEAFGKTARFRFVAPDIDVAGRALPFSAVADDMQFLCDAFALPRMAEQGWAQGDIVVSFSSQKLPFGEIAPDVTQFFQPFSIQDGRCMWEEH